MDLFPELTSFVIFLGMVLINYGVVNDNNLLKKIIGEFLSVLKNKYPNENINFFDFNMPYLKDIIINKDTVLIEDVNIVESLSPEKEMLIALEKEFDIIIKKAGDKNTRLKYSVEETNETIDIITKFRNDNKKILTQEQNILIGKSLKKLRDYRLKQMKNR